MKRLVIVEDEPVMSDFLTNYIDWSEIGVEISAVLDNGCDGLSAILSLRPDVVITDIKMPRMDGLTMLEHLVKERLETKVLILSGYSDFHMVKNAFRFGAADYILKSELEEETLKKLVLKLLDDGYSETEETDDLRNLLYKRNIIKALIFGSGKMPDENLKLRISEKNLSVIVIKMLDYEEALGEEWEHESELLKYGIINVTEELIDNEGVGEIIQDKNDELVVILSDSDVRNSNEFTEKVAQKLCYNIENVFGFKTCAGYCGFEDSWKMLRKLYNNARLAVDYTFIRGRSRALDYMELSLNHPSYDKTGFEQLILSFSKKMENFEFDLAFEIIDKYINDSFSAESLDNLYEFCDVCYYEIDRISRQWQLPVTEKNVYKKIMNCGTLRELKMYFKEELSKLSDGENDNVALIPRVKKYIDENYFKKITLESISEQFGVGHQKLSREFKKKTNKSLKKYLIEIRMNEAMKLIVSSDYMLYEIADMVGYANYENFSRMFYMHFKKWPRDIERP